MEEVTTPTPDNAARATPVAWVERTEGGLTRMWSGDLSAWAHRPANPEPLYSAATVTALEAEVRELRAAIRGIRFDTYELETPELVEAFDGNRRISVVHVETLHPLLQSLTGAGAK